MLGNAFDKESFANFLLHDYHKLLTCIQNNDLEGVKACFADWRNRGITLRVLDDAYDRVKEDKDDENDNIELPNVSSIINFTLYAAATSCAPIFDFLLNEQKLPFEGRCFDSLFNATTNDNKIFDLLLTSEVLTALPSVGRLVNLLMLASLAKMSANGNALENIISLIKNATPSTQYPSAQIHHQEIMKWIDTTVSKIQFEDNSDAVKQVNTELVESSTIQLAALRSSLEGVSLASDVGPLLNDIATITQSVKRQIQSKRTAEINLSCLAAKLMLKRLSNSLIKQQNLPQETTTSLKKLNECWSFNWRYEKITMLTQQRKLLPLNNHLEKFLPLYYQYMLTDDIESFKSHYLKSYEAGWSLREVDNSLSELLGVQADYFTINMIFQALHLRSDKISTFLIAQASPIILELLLVFLGDTAYFGCKSAFENILIAIEETDIITDTVLISLLSQAIAGKHPEIEDIIKRKLLARSPQNTQLAIDKITAANRNIERVIQERKKENALFHSTVEPYQDIIQQLPALLDNLRQNSITNNTIGADFQKLINIFKQILEAEKPQYNIFLKIQWMLLINTLKVKLRAEPAFKDSIMEVCYDLLSSLYIVLEEASQVLAQKYIRENVEALPPEVHSEILSRVGESAMAKPDHYEMGLYETIREKYQDSFTSKGLPAILKEFEKFLIEKFTANGLSTEYNPEWNQEELVKYYQNIYHTAWRYVFQRPCSWLAPRTSKQDLILPFDEDNLTILAYYWLAASDHSQPCTDGHQIEERIDHFADQLAFAQREHNYDKKVKISARGTLIDIDDLEGDKPTCDLGVRRRLYNLLIWHPIIDTVKPPMANSIYQQFREQLIADNPNASTQTLYDKLKNYTKEELKLLKEACEEVAITAFDFDTISAMAKTEIALLVIEPSAFIEEQKLYHGPKRFTESKVNYQTIEFKNGEDFINALAKEPLRYFYTQVVGIVNGLLSSLKQQGTKRTASLLGKEKSEQPEDKKARTLLYSYGAESSNASNSEPLQEPPATSITLRCTL